MCLNVITNKNQWEKMADLFQGERQCRHLVSVEETSICSKTRSILRLGQKIKNAAYLKFQSGHEAFWSWCSLPLSRTLAQRNFWRKKSIEKTIHETTNCKKKKKKADTKVPASLTRLYNFSFAP